MRLTSAKNVKSGMKINLAFKHVRARLYVVKKVEPLENGNIRVYTDSLTLKGRFVMSDFPPDYGVEVGS
jgi:hypothetical protein